VFHGHRGWSLEWPGRRDVNKWHKRPINEWRRKWPSGKDPLGVIEKNLEIRDVDTYLEGLC